MERWLAWLFGNLMLIAGLTALLSVAGLVVCGFAWIAGLGSCNLPPLTPWKPEPGSPEHEAELRKRVGNCVYTISPTEWRTLKESEIDRRLAVCAQMTIEYDRLYR